MKKVLFLIHTLGGGGAEKVLVDLVNNIDKKKFNVTVMTVVDVGIYKDKLDKDIKYKTMFRNVFNKVNKDIKKDIKEEKDASGSLLNKESRIKKILIRLYLFFWKYVPTKLLYRFFIKEKYDVEVAFLEGISAKVIAASNNKHSKKLVWIHVDLIKRNKSSKVFRNLQYEIETYNKFNKIIAVSKSVKDSFVSKFNIDENKVLVKHNPIDKKYILSKSQEKVEDIECKFQFTICSIGRLNSQKAYDRLLRIHKRLIDEKYNHNLWIIGEGTSREQLENYIKDNKLEDTAKLLGYKENPYKYLKAANLFVCSSITEGFSTVVSEATILGIPIVTTDCPGMKEILGENNEYGIVTENDEDALYHGIKSILENKGLYSEYKTKISNRANIFDLKESISKIDKILLQ